MDRYIGLDAHSSSCTLGVLGPSGKRLGLHVVETNAKALIEVLSPHVEEIVVTAVRESRGPKSDKLDAFGVAERLRIGAIKRKVYKVRGQFAALGHRAKAHGLLVGDAVRVMSRIKSLMRSRGVQVSGTAVYSATGHSQWITRLPQAARPAMELLYLELDALTQLRKRAEKQLITEARRHREYRILKSCPGLGPIRTAELLAIVVTPYRFANKRGFWSYCGLGIVMRSSSDWVRTRGGEWINAPVQQTRGLNRTSTAR